MARRASGDGSGMGGMAAPLIGVAINLLVFVILEIFAPTIAGTIAAGQPDLAWDSEWNNTYRVAQGLSPIPTGAETWTTVMQIIGVVFLVIAIAIAIYYLKGMA